MASATHRGRIIVNDTDYTGSFVDPNPSGTATDDLNTVSIDGKIFNVVGSGGGGSGSSYSETVLWSGNSSTSTWASPVTMSLNDSIRKYDELIIQFSDNAYGYAFVNIPTRDIPSDYAEKYFTNASFVYKNNSADAETGYVLVTADDEILGYTATGTTVIYTKVIGRKFGGNTVNLGAFIDTGRIIQAFTNITDTQEYTYTATEDCVITYYIPANTNSDVFIKIDNVQIGGGYSQYINAFSDYCFLKKGQTFSYQTTYTASSGAGYTVYGIQGGDGQLIAPVIYSTTEREIGVWTDNKPLYQKTFLFNQQVITDNAWTTNILGTVGSGIEIVDFDGTFGLTGNPHFADFSYYRGSSEYFTAYIPNNNGHNDDIAVRPNMNAGVNVTLDKCTIWYTKDSDTAGSGAYNTLGTPMQHYSTTEEVIGTWIDGRTLYRRVYDFTSSPITVPTNTWLKVANDWQIQPIRGTGIITSSRATFEVAIDCDDNDGLYVRSWLNYGNVNYLIVEYVKDSD